MKKILFIIMFAQIALVNAQVIGNGTGVLKKNFNVNSDANVPSGYYSLINPVNGSTKDSWQHFVTFRHVNLNGYALQLSAPYFNGNKLYFRTVSGGKFNQWLEVATRKDNSFYGSQVINGDSVLNKTSLIVYSGKSSKLVSSFYSANRQKRISIYNDDVNPMSIYAYDESKNLFSNLALGHNSNVSKQLLIDGNSGRVGIGILPSMYKLEVNGNAKFGKVIFGKSELKDDQGGGLELIGNDIKSTPYIDFSNTGGDFDARIILGINQKLMNKAVSGFEYYTDGNNLRMKIFRDGLVKIYTKLEAQEIEVKNLTLPDYVFDNSYNLKSLYEVEKFISQNKHLPEVPSAKQVAQDGMNLVEMNNAMLKKIEELTLYLIDQNKRIDVLEKQNSELLKK